VELLTSYEYVIVPFKGESGFAEVSKEVFEELNAL
jgi:hypothetical protein